MAQLLLPVDSSIRRGFAQGVQDGSQSAVETVARIHAVPELEDGSPTEARITGSAAG